MNEETWQTLGALNAEMRRLHVGQRRAEYASIVRRMVEYAREHLEPDHPDLGAALLNLAGVEDTEGHYAEGAAACEEAAGIFAESLGSDSSECVLALNNWGEFLSKTGEFPEAESLFRTAAKIARRAGLETHFATAKNNLGCILVSAGRYRPAERSFRDALRVRRRILGVDHPEVANSLNNLGDLCLRRGDYRKARRMFERALRVRAEIETTDPTPRASTLNNLATLESKLGNYAAAAGRFEEALALLRAAGLDASLEFAGIADNYGMLLGSIGRLDEAGELCRSGLELRRRLLPGSHPLVAQSLVNLGRLRFAAGDYAAAQRFETHALESLRTGGNRPLDRAAVLSALVETQAAIGNYAAAQEFCEEALRMRISILGERHPDTVVSLVDLAAVRAACGDFETARTLLEAAVAHRVEIFGEMHPEVANALGSLAAHLVNHGSRKEAEPLLGHSLAIRRHCLGARHPDTARALVKRGACSYETGRNDAARADFDEALGILEPTLGSHHPGVTDVLHRLALVDAATGNRAGALDRMLAATAREDTILDGLLAFGSEQHRIALLDTLRRSLHRLVSLAVTHFRQSPRVVEALLERVLRRKGLALTAAGAQRALAGRTHDAATQALLEENLELERQITRAILDGPRGSSAGELRTRVTEWISRKEALESQIAERLPGAAALPGRVRIEDVAAALPPDAALVEFVRYPCYEFARPAAKGHTPQTRYAAVLLTADPAPCARLLDLGPAEDIDFAIGRFRASIIEDVGDARTVSMLGPDEANEEGGSLLAGMVFDPLTAASPSTARWILAPDGDLASLPFDALPLPEGGCVFDRHVVSYVTSGRDLMSSASGLPSGPPLIIADPDFDLAGEASESLEGDERAAAPPRSLARAGVRFAQISGARAEGIEIAELLGVAPLVGAEALESTLRRAQSPLLLHLATHGFFLRDRPLQPDDFETTEGWADQLAAADNPMFRSGLALAGANTWLRGAPLPPGAEDGILTAQDVCGLDLRATEIAVLSACDTGLGEAHHGEGVFGLRRAFSVAGARTLIMSLWKVSDLATRELMREFYEGLAAGRPRLEALRVAQAAARTRRSQAYYWAAFICEGATGPVSTLAKGIDAGARFHG